MPRTEEKSLGWITDLFSKFCRARELELNTLASALSTSPVCLPLPKHRRFFIVKYFRILSAYPSIALRRIREARFEFEVSHS